LLRVFGHLPRPKIYLAERQIVDGPEVELAFEGKDSPEVKD